MEKEHLQIIKERAEQSTRWTRFTPVSVGTWDKTGNRLDQCVQLKRYEDAIFLAHAKVDILELVATVEMNQQALEYVNSELQQLATLSEKVIKESTTLAQENTKLREALRQIKQNSFAASGGIEAMIDAALESGEDQ